MQHDDTEARRNRLRALRERHAQQDQTASGGEPPADAGFGDDLPPAAGRRGPGPGLGPGAARKKRRGGPLGGGRRRQAMGGGGGAAGEGAGERGASVQRLLHYLTQPGPGGRLIPGTEIKEDRVKQVMQFLRHRAERGEGQGSGRIQRVVGFLTREEEGAPMAAGVNVQNLVRLVSMLQQRQAGAAEGLEAQDPETDELDQVFDRLVADEPAAPPPAAPQPAPEAIAPPPPRDDAINDTLHQLVGLTQRLSEQLEATQQQVEALQRERQDPAPAPAEAPPAAETKPEANKRPGSDWFEEYLD